MRIVSTANLQTPVQFLKFAVVGAGNTLITFASYSLLLSLKVHYLAANVASYVCGMANGFFWSKKWVFKAQNQGNGQFIKFGMVNLCSLAINTSILFILVQKFGLNKVLSQLCATAITVIINFLANKLWTFKNRTYKFGKEKRTGGTASG